MYVEMGFSTGLLVRSFVGAFVVADDDGGSTTAAAGCDPPEQPPMTQTPTVTAIATSATAIIDSRHTIQLLCRLLLCCIEDSCAGGNVGDTSG